MRGVHWEVGSVGPVAVDGLVENATGALLGQVTEDPGHDGWCWENLTTDLVSGGHGPSRHGARKALVADVRRTRGGGGAA